MLEVYLIGTVHVDIRKGAQRLYRALKKIKPTVVIGEVDDTRANNILVMNVLLNNGMMDRIVEQQIVQHNANPQTAKEYFLNDGYEYRVAHDYCRRNDIPMIHGDVLTLDSAMPSNTYIKGEKNDLLRMSPDQLQVFADKMYESELGRLSKRLRKEFERRDKGFAECIMQQSGTVLFPTGMLHVYGGYNNVYRRLVDVDSLNLHRSKLNEF